MHGRHSRGQLGSHGLLHASHDGSREVEGEHSVQDFRRLVLEDVVGNGGDASLSRRLEMGREALWRGSIA